MLRAQLGLLALSAFVAATFGPRAYAIDSSNVLVLYNTDDQTSQDIANYYQQVHPGVHLLGLGNLGTSTTITASQYLTDIRQPIIDSGALTSDIDVIVTTKGMPLQIQVQSSNPGTYVDAWGVPRVVSISNWRPDSSLESELTKIDYIANETMMGDQSFNFPTGHFDSNAYYGSNASFNYGNFTGQDVMRLTSRLDGFSLADVKSSIDNAQHAYVGPNNTPGGPGHFIIDNDPSLNYADQTMTGMNNLLNAHGLPHVYDDTSAFVSTSGGPLLGYTSHGAHQASTPDHYINAIGDTLAPGAVFNSWESYNAQSFTPGGNWGNQALVGEWLARGGTAAVGNVAEPGASINNVFNEDQLFSMLLDGKTFAEAAWSAMRQLSWVNTAVGDPLMTWKQLLPGDANLDGIVDVRDINAMGKYWGKAVPGNGYGWAMGDLNGDGFVDFADLALIDSSWGQRSYWSDELMSLNAASSPKSAALLASLHFTPEPSSIALAAVGLATLASFAWRQRARGRGRRTS